MKSRVSKEKLQKLITLSRKKGLKLTPQRMAIFRIISESDKHLSADEIYQKAKKDYPMLSAATVYRNLEQLVSAGLLSHLSLGGTAMKYDSNMEEHHHFICNRCGKVQDIYLKKVTYELDTEKTYLDEFEVFGPELYLHGVCKDCLE
ncbi:MAG: transcriptional repressor [Deltaproteobacteria bacterium]|jgi:Fur family peroxide stress response transcriptional regulator|nr:MAG: transcriptional repressor [Deltaproteobacteria bacterium]